MIEREYEELIQDVLDGPSTPEQMARLEAYLAGSEAGRTRRRELELVFGALRRVEMVEAPADLRQQVLVALRARAVPAPGRSPARAGIRRWLAGPHIRLAYVFAAGLAAGSIGFGALSGVLTWPPGEPAVTGTMMAPRPTTPAAGAARRVWVAGMTRVEAVSWRVANSRLAAFQIRGAGEAQIELEFDARSLSPVGVRQTHPGGSRVQLEPGRVAVLGQDRGEYTIEFLDSEEAGPPIRVTIRSGGTTAQGDLPAGAAISAAR